MKKHKVAGIGELLWDMFPAGRQLGGATANFSYHAGLMGARASVVSAVGEDEGGKALRATLRKLGLNDTWVQTDQDHPTGIVRVEVDVAGKPEYVIAENCAWDYLKLTAVLTKLAPELDAVCFGTLGQRNPVTCAAIREFLRLVNPDCLRVFDVNLRGRFFDAEVLRESMLVADVLKISDEELPVVAHLLEIPGSDDESRLENLRVGYKLDMIVLTRGAKGSLLVDNFGSDDYPGLPVKVVDTVGAGDSFTAAVTMGRLNRLSLPQINYNANILAACVCSCRGATPDVGQIARAKTKVAKIAG